MVNTRYANAFKEVDYYLKGIREEDIEKIPNKLKEFIKVNASEDYLVDFDYNKPLSEITISKEAKGIISIICLNYWCENEEEKREYLGLLNTNEQEYQKILREKYNPENIFKSDRSINLNSNAILSNNQSDDNDNNNDDDNSNINELDKEMLPIDLNKDDSKNIIKKIWNRIKSIFVKK